MDSASSAVDHAAATGTEALGCAARGATTLVDATGPTTVEAQQHRSLTCAPGDGSPPCMSTAQQQAERATPSPSHLSRVPLDRNRPSTSTGTTASDSRESIALVLTALPTIENQPRLRSLFTIAPAVVRTIASPR